MCLIDLCYNNLINYNDFYYDLNSINKNEYENINISNSINNNQEFEFNTFLNVGKELFLQDCKNTLIKNYYENKKIKKFKINKNSKEICNEIYNNKLNNNKLNNNKLNNNKLNNNNNIKYKMLKNINFKKYLVIPMLVFISLLFNNNIMLYKNINYLNLDTSHQKMRLCPSA